jgi:hypothetical protein
MAAAPSLSPIRPLALTDQFVTCLFSKKNNVNVKKITHEGWRGEINWGILLLRSTTEMRFGVHVEIPLKFAGNFVSLLSFELTTTLIKLKFDRINN